MHIATQCVLLDADRSMSACKEPKQYPTPPPPPITSPIPPRESRNTSQNAVSNCFRRGEHQYILLIEIQIQIQIQIQVHIHMLANRIIIQYIIQDATYRIVYTKY